MTEKGILRVAVNAPLFRLFDYRVPPTGGTAAHPGCRVKVPFGRRRIVGLVVDVAAETDVPQGKLRQATEVLDDEPLLGADDLWMLRFVSSYYHHPIGEVAAAALPTLLRQGRPLLDKQQVVGLTPKGAAVEIGELERRAPRQCQLLALLAERHPRTADDLETAMPGWRRVLPAMQDKGWLSVNEQVFSPPAPRTVDPIDGPPLNDEQRHALAAIGDCDEFRATLLHGVTGSGKTEVYLRVMQAVIAAGRQVLVLVPEIGLTPQFVSRLEARLGTPPALLHSALTDTERLAAWRRARDGSAAVVLGTRSAVFTPLARPGLIVIDEEHDTSFKQQEGLRYSARDVALARAKRLSIPIILGSATPSLESLQRAADGYYQRATLAARAGGVPPPHLRLIDVNRFRNEEGLSPPLLDAIGTHLDRGGQALVYLNRRGFAPTLICNECGAMAECRRCDSRMTVHRRAGHLTCHHCGAGRPIDDRCAECGGQMRPLGEGTERIEDALAQRYPGVPMRRIDSDTMRLKGAMDEALAAAVSGEARILIGTQMLSKGHHFPRLSLVGVVNADQGLFSTDFRGGERLAQSLVQVAGRAGRERQQGDVLIQTAFPGNPFWKALLTGGYARVAELSLTERRAAGWPPWSHLALVRASAHQRGQTTEFLERIAAGAAAILGDRADVRVLGPVSAPMERLAGRYRGQLLLQATERRPLHTLLANLEPQLEGDAAARRVRWSIDVDPVELF